MARSVRVGDFQAMQRNAAEAVAAELRPADEHERPSATTVPEQLAALEIRGGPDATYHDVVQRLKTRCSLLDIPALDEEIAAEARRRCRMLPEPTIEDAVAAADGLSLLADAPDEVIASLGQDDPAGDGPADPKADDRAAQILADKHAGGLHAGFEPVGGCPSCEAAGDDAQVEPKAEDQAERLGPNIHGIGPDTDHGPNPDYDPNADPLATIADHLRGLNVEASCTAEMSLHMITEWVREATAELDYLPITDADIVAEAERIWVSLDRKRSHTYSVEQDGTIRDWRRPDTTPDRGDVTAVHTITDDEPRFSGAGAGQQGLFLVPTDAAFNGRQYRDAPELANIAERLIGEHGFLEQLENCDVRWYWKRKTGVSKGRVKIGFMKRASDLLGHFSGADFIGWLSATTARDGKFTDTQIEAAVFHQLCHIGSDDSGNWIFAPHDFEGFAAEVRVFGTWTSDLKLGGNAFVAAHQMGLFTDEDEDEDAEDDGSGVLIHADGTPLTADEIEAMERHELNDDPADPDARYDDPLADVDL